MQTAPTQTASYWRRIGLVMGGAIFAFSIFQLAYSPMHHCGSGMKMACGSQSSVSVDTQELWRGIAVGSLYVLFCLPAPRRVRTPARTHRDPMI